MTVPVDMTDIVLRLAAAGGTGIVLGLNRDLHGKPTGVRTLGLVALSAALVALATINLPMISSDPDAMSRVVQGLIQGVLPGIGFLGAGVIFRSKDGGSIENLTTAATVWITAVLGLACGLAAWPIVGLGLLLSFLLLISGGLIETLTAKILGSANAPEAVAQAKPEATPPPA